MRERKQNIMEGALSLTAYYSGFIEMGQWCVSVCVCVRGPERLIHCFDIFILIIIVLLVLFRLF